MLGKSPGAIRVLAHRGLKKLHELLSGLPLFAYLDIRVTALAQHPNAV